jgi:hypothetical protein
MSQGDPQGTLTGAEIARSETHHMAYYPQYEMKHRGPCSQTKDTTWGIRILAVEMGSTVIGRL